MSASRSFRSPRRWKTATERSNIKDASNTNNLQPLLLGGVVHTPIWQPFLFSTIAPTVAAPFTNPFGVARTQLQAQSSRNKLFSGALDYFRKGFASPEGASSALQRGIAPVVMREASMNLFRIGLYQPCLDRIHDHHRRDPQHEEYSNKNDRIPKEMASSGTAPVSKRLAAGAVAGAIGAVACNPFEILRVRMQVQPLQTNPADVMTTRGVFREIVKEEGFKTLYRATGTSVLLGMVCTSVNMSTYTLFREEALHRFRMKDGAVVDVGCALSSGFLSALAMNPIDVVRTRMISDRSSPPKFRNGLHAARVLLSQEGPAAFMKGFVPSFLRIGPHFVITFMVLEQFRRMAREHNASRAEEAWYTRTFHGIDANDSGDISRDEFRAALLEVWPRDHHHHHHGNNNNNNNNNTNDETSRRQREKDETEAAVRLADEIFAKADADGNGSIDLQEFLSAAASSRLDGLLRGRRLLAIFRSLDADGSGGIDEEELYTALRDIRYPNNGDRGGADSKESLGAEEARQLRVDVATIMNGVDEDGDGVIEFSEFATAVDNMDDLDQRRFLEELLRGCGVAQG